MATNWRNNVLVLGGAGYIGSVLCRRLLDEGYQVKAYDNLRYGNAHALASCWGPGFTFVKEDIRDQMPLLRALKYADAVVNLAALVGAPVCDRNRDEAVSVNKDAAAWVAKALSRHQRLIYANTNSGYGAPADASEVTEESPLNPLSLYGETKVKAEKVALSTHPDCVSLRLATVCGVSPRMRCDLLVNDLTFRLAEAAVRHRAGTPARDKLVIYEPNHVRNFVHVDDVVNVILHFLGNSCVGAYNVAAWNMTKLQLVEQIASLVSPCGDELYEVGEGADPDGRNCSVSSHKLKATGFQFCRTKLDAAICELASYFQMTNFIYTGNA